jgi:hypothetical protein
MLLALVVLLTMSGARGQEFVTTCTDGWTATVVLLGSGRQPKRHAALG